MSENDPTPEPDAPDDAPGAAAAPVHVGRLMRDTMAEMLDTMEGADRVRGAADAARARLIDQARLVSEALAVEQAADGAQLLGREPHGWNSAARLKRQLEFDIAARLRIPERTAQNLIGEAKLLVHTLGATLDALAAGEVAYGHAQVMVAETAGLDADVVAELEAELLPWAKELTVPKFRELARRWREARQPDSMEERKRDAVKDRTVWVDPQRDGMSYLTALLPAEVAAAAHDRIAAIARALNSTDDDRTTAQRKADVLADLLVDGDLCEKGEPGDTVAHGIRPQVSVTVPVLTLLGVEETPGDLHGYGPISPDTARNLAAHAPSFARILTHPVTSAILDFDKTKYAVPADLATVVRLQHQTCAAPGCRRPAGRCDLDHTIPFAGSGTTSLANLAPLCPDHHNVKHHTQVEVAKRSDGSMEWTTATGKTVIVRPSVVLGDGMLQRGSPPGDDPPGSDPPDRGWPDTGWPDIAWSEFAWSDDDPPDPDSLDADARIDEWLTSESAREVLR